MAWLVSKRVGSIHEVLGIISFEDTEIASEGHLLRDWWASLGSTLVNCWRKDYWISGPQRCWLPAWLASKEELGQFMEILGISRS